MFEKILVPLDGSELAKQALGCVSDLVKTFSPEVVIAGVCEPHEAGAEQACRDYIGEEARRLQGISPALKLQTVVLHGRPAELILDYAEKNDIGLIVISSHGRSGIRPWSLGSTANKVLHKVGVPLIMVRAARPGAAPPPAGVFKKILVPLDGSERGESILPYVAEIHRRIASEVVLFRVVEPGTHVRSVGGLDYVRFEDRDIETTKAEALAYLKKAAAGLADGVTFEVRVGDAAEEIITFAAESGSTLVAMPSHGHSGIESWLYGSVTYKVLQAGKEAVMLVPSGNR